MALILVFPLGSLRVRSWRSVVVVVVVVVVIVVVGIVDVDVVPYGWCAVCSHPGSAKQRWRR